MAPAPPVAHKFRTPDVVKFAGSPQAGQALDGGGTVSLRTDAQGKTFGAALLALEIEV